MKDTDILKVLKKVLWCL